jgi:transcription antitermination factor NusG
LALAGPDSNLQERTLADAASLGPAAEAPWYVLWTHSHCEALVEQQLEGRGLHPYLPRIDAWSVRAGQRRRISVPMFPGYLFLHDVLDRAAHVEVLKARGLVRVLGERWDRPAEVPAGEVEAIARLASSRLSTFAHPYLREGRRVRIVTGPLAGVEGILAEVRRDRGLLVISVHLLQRSVAVQVDCAQVEPA